MPFEFEILENQDHTVIPAGAINTAPKAMSLELARIKYTVSPHKMNKGHSIPRPPEELFLLENMAPATHSHNITNEYFLNANIKYDGCTCISELPSISVPMTVIPLTHEESYGMTEPEGFNPTFLAQFTCIVNRCH